MAGIHRVPVILLLSAIIVHHQAQVEANCLLPPDDARFVQSYLGPKMRYVRDRADFRNYSADFGNDVTVDLFYMESAVSGANGVITTGIAELFSQYHSGLRGEISHNGEHKATFVLEFWGNGNSTVAPYCVDEDGPKWQYDAVIVYTDGWDESKWFGHRTAGFQIASLPDADSVNELFDFVYTEWANNTKKRKYMQWQLWTSRTPGGDAQHNNYDLICHSFTESLIWHLPKIGGKFHTPTLMIRRNYGVILSEDAEERPANHPEVISFFEGVLEKGQAAYLEANINSRPVFIYDQFQDRYLRLGRPSIFKQRIISWVYVRYTDMPLPPEYYRTCDRQRLVGQCPEGTCLWESLSGRLDHLFFRYCKGKQEPELLDLQALPEKFNSIEVPDTMACAMTAFAAIGAVSAVAVAAEKYRQNARMDQPPLLG